MQRKLVVACVSLVALVLVFGLLLAETAQAQLSSVRPVITQRIDEGRLVTLRGNTRPEATAINDRGALPYDTRMEHMLLQLQRSPEQEKALREYIDELQEPNSPNYHKWLTAEEFGERYGLTHQDLDEITGWLTGHGLTVNLVYTNRILIDFSGTAGQVHDAFKTEIHSLDVGGVKHIANMSDPKIPAALAPAVVGVVSLHDFKPHTNHKMKSQYTVSSSEQLVVPADLATIYNLNPLFTASNSGQGQTVVVIEDTNVYAASDWTTFRSTFGLSSYTSGSFTQVNPAPATGPNNCTNPGTNGDSGEATLDAEWASAAAPSAAIVLASCADSTSFGGLIALQNLLTETTPPEIVSISYGECEAFNGAASNAAYSAAYQQAVTAGVSVFVSSGDQAAASCDASESGVTAATHGISVSAFTSTIYNVSVGGTDFGDTVAGTNSTYWNTTNSATFGSALSYVPEIPWDDSCASVLIATYVTGNPSEVTYGSSGFCNSPTASGDGLLNIVGGSGGPSGCATGTPTTSGVVSGTCAGYAKPSWQVLVGVPADGVRDIPDVSLFAANGIFGHAYVFCYSDPSGGTPCTGAPSGWSLAGGTSFASPIWAGFQALINQKAGARQGNPNPEYYTLAATEYGASGSTTCNSTLGNGVGSSCVFYDVTKGDMDVDCTGTNSCYLPSGTYGVLSTSDSSYLKAYGTTTGWDFATGIGTVNVTNLANAWPASTSPNFSLSAAPTSVTIVQGGAGGTSTITVTPAGGFTGSVTLSASGLPTGVTAAFGTNPATTTSVLTLTASATATTGAATVTITGVSGALTHTTTVSLTVNASANFSLSAAPSSVTIVQGAAGGTSTITVTPAGGFTGSVTLSASGLPTGVTAAFGTNPATTTSVLTLTASATATTGAATVTITGVSGALTHTTTVSLTVNASANFSLSAAPTSVSITQGGAGGTSTITVTPANGFTGSVTLSASGLPTGVTAAFGTNPATTTSVLTLTASATATTGAATVTITGVSGALTHTTTVSLTVNASVNFSLSAAPTSVTIVQGGAGGTSTVTITPANGFTGSVTLSASGLPTGVTAAFGTNPATTTSVLTLTASATATTGAATVTITGVSGALTHTTTVSLTVNPSANFSLSAAPSSVTIVQGAAGGTSTITVTPAGGFTGSVTLSASGLPTGVTAAFGTNPATTTSVLTLTASATATTGAATVTITGVSGALTHTTTVSLTVNPSANFSLSAAPSSVTIVQGAAGGTSTITVTPAGGFTGSVTLSASGLPTGVTAAFGTNPATTTSVLTLTASATATTGAATVTITGVSGALTHTTTISLTVNTPAPDFSLSSSVSSLTIFRLVPGEATITVHPINGFTGSVNLSVSNLPSGVSATVAPNPTTSTSTVTLHADDFTKLGTSTLTVTGTSGSLTHTVTFSLTIDW